MFIGGAIVRTTAGMGGFEVFDLPDALSDEIARKVEECVPWSIVRSSLGIDMWMAYMAPSTLHIAPDLLHTHLAMSRDTWVRGNKYRRPGWYDGHSVTHEASHLAGIVRHSRGSRR